MFVDSLHSAGFMYMKSYNPTDLCGYHRPSQAHPDTLAIRAAAKDFFLGLPLDVIEAEGDYTGRARVLTSTRRHTSGSGSSLRSFRGNHCTLGTASSETRTP